MVCYSCNQTGHITRNCPSQQAEGQGKRKPNGFGYGPVKGKGKDSGYGGYGGFGGFGGKAGKGNGGNGKGWEKRPATGCWGLCKEHYRGSPEYPAQRQARNMLEVGGGIKALCPISHRGGEEAPGQTQAPKDAFILQKRKGLISGFICAGNVRGEKRVRGNIFKELEDEDEDPEPQQDESGAPPLKDSNDDEEEEWRKADEVHSLRNKKNLEAEKVAQQISVRLACGTALDSCRCTGCSPEEVLSGK